VPARCPDCGGTITETRVATQVQEDLPLVRPHVRRFDVHVGHCGQCGRRVQGRHPLQTSDALGAAGTHLGPQAVALIVLLNKYLGLSHGKIAVLLREWFRLTVRPSTVTHALHRAARQAAPTYAALREAIRASPVVSPDETSWKVGGRLQWLWAFATPSVVLYAIQAGRGFPQAAAVLSADFDGVLVRDGGRPIGASTRPHIKPVWRICCAGLATWPQIIRVPRFQRASTLCCNRRSPCGTVERRATSPPMVSPSRAADCSTNSPIS
jgi:transposase